MIFDNSFDTCCTYLALAGPTLSTSNDELAFKASSGMRPLSIPNAMWQSAEKNACLKFYCLEAVHFKVLHVCFFPVAISASSKEPLFYKIEPTNRACKFSPFGKLSSQVNISFVSR